MVDPQDSTSHTGQRVFSPGPVKSGVPMGIVLGLTMFLIYINDIMDYIM